MLTNAHLVAPVRHADDDQADSRPRVEPAVEQAQLGRARLIWRKPSAARRLATRLLGTLKLDPDLAVDIQHTQVLVPAVFHNRGPAIPTAILTPTKNSVHDSERAV